MSEPNRIDNTNREIVRSAFNGWFMLVLNIVLFFGGLALLVRELQRSGGELGFNWLIVLGIALPILAVILLGGLFTLQPNEARVLILFGDYHGTVRSSGFFWANPFYSRSRAGGGALADIAKRHGPNAATASQSPSTKISLRARNFNSDKLKVNDKRGNPVEIAAVIVWRVEDTAKAAFDVDDFESYVQIQSESAIRHIASLYSYDRADDDGEPTLARQRGRSRAGIAKRTAGAARQGRRDCR